MNFTSEQVHWIFGTMIASSAVLLVLRESGRLSGGWLNFVTPSLLLLFGIEMLVDPWVHGSAAPSNYAAETTQHFILGLLLIGSAVAEMVRVKRRGEGWLWRLPFAGTLMIAAGVFAFHAQHDSPAPMTLLIAQHRIIAATLGLASLAFLFAPPREGGRAPSAFSVLVLLLGFELLLYTEGNTIFGERTDAHPMEMPS
jgi:uncharacterized membrane protein HdeD (DUF308 family)